MDPLIVAKLTEETPEFSALRKYLAEEAMKLNTLEGLEGLDFKERAYEVHARVLAFAKLRAILEPLVNFSTAPTAFDPNEYVIE